MHELRMHEHVRYRELFHHCLFFCILPEEVWFASLIIQSGVDHTDQSPIHPEVEPLQAEESAGHDPLKEQLDMLG